MQFPNGKIPAFSAGPLLMPPIQLSGLRIQNSIPVEEQNARPSARAGNSSRRFNLRRFGTRFLFAARVRPLTLSSLMRDESTGVPPLSQIEAYRWAQARKQTCPGPVRAIRPEASL